MTLGRTVISLQIAAVLAAAAVGGYVRHLETELDQQNEVLCGALRDARDRAYASLLNQPADREREVGKVTKSMALLGCPQTDEILP